VFARLYLDCAIYPLCTCSAPCRYLNPWPLSSISGIWWHTFTCLPTDLYLLINLFWLHVMAFRAFKINFFYFGKILDLLKVKRAQRLPNVPLPQFPLMLHITWPWHICQNQEAKTGILLVIKFQAIFGFHSPGSTLRLVWSGFQRIGIFLWSSVCLTLLEGWRNGFTTAHVILLSLDKSAICVPAQMKIYK
jgi:hypothetical protein